MLFKNIIHYSLDLSLTENLVDMRLTGNLNYKLQFLILTFSEL